MGKYIFQPISLAKLDQKLTRPFPVCGILLPILASFKKMKAWFFVLTSADLIVI